MSVSDEDIVFITSSLNTKWIKYCKTLVKHYFPTSEHIIINSNRSRGWWFKWLEYLKTRKERYFCMLDEDCFLETHDGIINVIEEMEKTNKSLAGVPDSFFAVRHVNTVCLNPFFMIGKTADINVVIKLGKYKTQLYRHEFKDKIDIKWEYNKDRIVIRKYEYFYTFFYAILEAGYSFLYLYPHDDYNFANDDKTVPATVPMLMPNTDRLALHMWYSREWSRPHSKNRYIKLEQYFKEKYPNII